MGQLALHRAAPVHPALNQISRSIRESAPPGSTWLTDISHPHEPDFDGNIYGRLFAEETTAYAREYFSSDKSCASLVLHLTQLQSWILKHVPGGKLVLLRCDFGSEYAKQGHGDDILTRALSAFCDANPGLRVYPVAPRAQMHNAVELVVQKVMGHAFMNAIRACVGGPICGFLHRGGCFQHNHRISHSQCLTRPQSSVKPEHLFLMCSLMLLEIRSQCLTRPQSSVKPEHLLYEMCSRLPKQPVPKTRRYRQDLEGTEDRPQCDS